VTHRFAKAWPDAEPCKAHPEYVSGFCRACPAPVEKTSAPAIDRGPACDRHPGFAKAYCGLCTLEAEASRKAVERQGRLEQKLDRLLETFERR
jgi:hypothetical protein